ncbi:MAG TPA: TlpA disulfide reductase family protein [Bacteroidia bacterium]|nr:TlpA disulfide reductase family protein [Bacteroidia bacterium]
MNKKLYFLALSFVQMIYCLNLEAQKQILLKDGNWRAALRLNDSTELPFYFDAVYTNGSLSIEILNAKERIVVDEISLTSDSLNFRMPVFDSEFKCRNYYGTLQGVWINHARKDHNTLPFSAKQEPPPNYTKASPTGLAGNWEATFSPGLPDSSKAIGIFKQDHAHITGTFLTETGDYRYLDGTINGTVFKLACFDGSHAYLFQAELKDGKLAGDFYSGATGHEKWIAVHNEQFHLRDPDSLTWLKKGIVKMDFKFPNTEGREVSLDDSTYRNKVVVVQIMGSWCPNCMDETRYLAEEYKKNKTKGLEVIALAFERSAEPASVRENINRLKKRFGADYEFLITGKPGNAKAASEALPMLNAVMAFPTSIYIDRKGNVRKIYTGFSGPGTGIYYERFKEENERFIEKLLSE